MKNRRPLRWRAGDAVDEWAHRRGFGMIGRPGHARCRWYWRLTPFPVICNRRELSYGVPAFVLNNQNITMSAQTSMVIEWGRGSHHEDGAS